MSRVEQLPIERDFDPWRGDLDAKVAWRNFGGLTLTQAKDRFAQNPECYQEDFMFMGTKAFLFYFPVLDHYLRNAPNIEDDDDHESWIISQCIQAQFRPGTVDQLRRLVPTVVDLAGFVRSNVRRFGRDRNERQRVKDVWSDLVQHIELLY